MLIFTEYQIGVQLINSRSLNDPVIFNLTGFNQNIQDLACLRSFAYNNLQAIYVGDKTSDIYFYNVIMSDNQLFFDFMNIISNLYYNKDVIICTSESDYMNIISDFFINLIRDRYEYQGVILNNIEDFFDLNSGDFSFSRNGLVNLDLDMNRVFFEMNKNSVIQKIENGQSIYEDTV